jgi:hypothetical protein
MSNSLLTINMITREAVMLFKNTNLFIQNLDTQYDADFAVDGAKIGQSIRIRLPNDYVTRSGPALSVQDTQEQSTTLTLNNQTGVDVGFSTAERTMSIDDYAERVLMPMMNNLVGDIATKVMQASEGGVCNFISNTDGAGNIIAPTQSQVLRVKAVMMNNSAPWNNIKLAVDPETDAKVVSALTGLLNPVTEISEQYRSGEMKNGLGIRKWFADQTVIKHTTGTFSAGGAYQSTTAGTTINVTAITGTFRAGDIITIDGVNAVNWVNKNDLGTLRQFVVTANVITGATSIPIFPAIIAPNVPGVPVQYQSVASAPVLNAQVRLVTKAGEVYRKSIGFCREAITMGTADLVMPKKAVEEAARANYDGISIRMITDYITGTDQMVTRLDVLWGVLYVRPQWAVILADNI